MYYREIEAREMRRKKLKYKRQNEKFQHASFWKRNTNPLIHETMIAKQNK